MIGRRGGADRSESPVTLGYAEFVRRLADPAFSQWFERLGNELKLPSDQSHRRLVSVQRTLIDVVDLLDPAYVRYPNLDARGKLPPPLAGRDRAAVEVGERVARFRALGREYGEDNRTFPTGTLAAWAQRHDLEQLELPHGLEWTAYRGKLDALGTDVVVHVHYRDRRMEIYASVESPRWARATRLAPATIPPHGGGRRFPRARRRARVIINDLLEQFARPTLR